MSRYATACVPPVRRKPKPPPQIVLYAALARCPDCDADKRLRWDGVNWHLELLHDCSCPVLNGAAPFGSGLRCPPKIASCQLTKCLVTRANSKVILTT